MGQIAWLSSISLSGLVIGFLSGYTMGYAGIIPAIILSVLAGFVITFMFQKGGHI